MQLDTRKIPKPQLSPQRDRSFIKSLKTSKLIKFGLLSVNASFVSKGLSAFIFAVAHIQIFSIFAHTYLTFQEKRIWFHEILDMIHQVTSIGGLWAIDRQYKLTFVALLIITIILLMEIFCMIHLVVSLFIDKLYSLWINRIWCFMTYIHINTLFYPIHLIGLSTLSMIWKDTEDSGLTLMMPRLVLKTIIIAILFWNLIYSAGTLIFLRPKIKTKNLLSSHTRFIDFIDLIIKLINPIFWYLRPNSSSLYTTLLGVNFVFSLFRDAAILWFLPYYNISILKTSMYFHGSATIFSFSVFLPKIISYWKISDNPLFSTLVFIMMSPLLTKLYSMHLQKTFISILANPHNINSYHLLQYWNVCKYFSFESRFQSSDCYIYHHGVRELHLTKDASSSTSDSKTDLFKKQTLFKSFLNLIKLKIQHSPNKQILNCCLARHYSKAEELYILADDLVNTGVKASSSMSLILSFYLIKIELFKKTNRIERHIQRYERDQASVIQANDIQKYFQIHDAYEDVKNHIIEQLKSQIKFWENVQVQQPDCCVMFHLAKEVSKKAHNMKKCWSWNQSLIDNHFTQPYLLFGLYHSFVLNDFESGDRFISLYHNSQSKNNEGAVNVKIDLQILAHSIQLSISGYPGSFGKIIDCSNNIEALLGYKKEMVIGKLTSTIVPDLFSDKQEDSDKLTKSLDLNRSREVIALDKKGYLVSCQAHSALKYLKEGMLCYYILLHPLTDKRRIVTIRNNGKMLNCSRGFKKDLGFSAGERANLNLYAMCPKLKKVIDGAQQLSSPLEGPIENLLFKTVMAKSVSTEQNKESWQKDYQNELFLFGFPPQKEKSLNLRKIISYHIKLESSFFEGERIITVNLTRANAHRTVAEMEVAPLKVINAKHEEELCESISNETTFREQLITPGLTTDSFRRGRHSLEKNFLKEDSRAGAAGNQVQQRDKLLFKANRNIESARRKTNQKNIIIPTLSEENEEFKLLKTTTERNGLNSPLNSATALSPRSGGLGTGGESNKRKNRANEDRLAINITDNGNERISDGLRKSRLKFSPGKSRLEFSEKSFVEELLHKNYSRLRQKAKTHKDIKEKLEQRKYKKSTIIYNIMFGLAMLVELVFSVWLNYNVLNASQEAANLSEVLQATYFRTYWLNLVNMEDRLWLALVQGWSNWDLDLQISISNLTYTRFNAHNQMFKRSVSNLKPELQYIFFEKNVNVYERNQKNELVIVSVDNSFQVVERILDRAIRNMNKGLQVPEILPEFSINSDSQFIYDNSYDDLLIASDRLIQAVVEDLFRNLSRASKYMTTFLSISISLIAVFVAYSFKIVIDINNDYQYFLKSFLTLSSRDVKKTEILLSNLHNAIKDGFEIRQKELGSASFAANLEPSHNRRGISKTSLNRLHHQTWNLLFQLNLAIVSVLAFMFVYYARALNEITTIESHQKHINSALENLNREILVGTQIQALTMENGTSTIRHQAILQALKENLNNLQAVDEILKNLKDPNGELSPRQQQIFFNLTCSKAYTPFYIIEDWISIDACNIASKGSGNLGLANIIPEFSTNVAQYLLDFENSDKSISSLQAVYSEVQTILLGLVDICTVFFLLSFEATIAEYQILMSDLEEQRNILAWVAVDISLILSVLLWLLVIRKLLHKTFETKEMLKLVPIKLILKNFLLKKYINDL